MVNNRLILNGNLNKIHRELTDLGVQLDIDETKKFLQYLTENKNSLNTDEKIERLYDFPNGGSGYIGFMVLDYSYFINVKSLTLCLFLWISDNPLVKGIIKKLLNVLGFSENFFEVINEYNGEKCIIKEIVLHNNRTGNLEILSKFKGKCCNNDIKCSFREEENCHCSQSDIEQILNSLTKRNILKKIDALYKLNW